MVVTGTKCTHISNNAPRDRFQWFNTTCFVQPAFGTWGNSGQGIINDPGINVWNSTIAKSFPIREDHRVEFRFETYNTFNHTQWLGAIYNRSTASFGRISGARPRSKAARMSSMTSSAAGSSAPCPPMPSSACWARAGRDGGRAHDRAEAAVGKPSHQPCHHGGLAGECKLALLIEVQRHG